MEFLMIKERHRELYFNIAKDLAEMSYDPDTQVGCVLVKDSQVISQGWNGTSDIDDNQCKDSTGHTLDTVIHAEMNCICRCTKKGISTEGAAMFLTHSPCFNCAKMIYLAGIKEVYYINEWKDSKPLEYLKKHGIKLYKKETNEKTY
jgi:dCMP deaminase